MKTEDQILAQLRASQNINLQNIPLPREPAPPIPPPPKDDFPPSVGMTPNLEDLQKLIREDTLKEPTSVIEASAESQEQQVTIKNTYYQFNFREGIATCIVSNTFFSFLFRITPFLYTLRPQPTHFENV